MGRKKPSPPPPSEPDPLPAVAPTPGPWEIDRSGRYYPPCVRANGVIIAYLPDGGADLLNPAPARAEDAANARLIAAAPAMLAALQAVADKMGERDHPDVWFEVLAAIHKATGEG